MSPNPDAPRQQISSTVAGHAVRLHRRYRDHDQGAAGDLARLRASGTRLGVDPATWPIFEIVPADLRGQGDDPSRAERAIFAALVLFAVHQQGHRTQCMHESGVGLGRAVRSLSGSDEVDRAVVRRFRELGTATSLEGTLRHLRSMIGLLRGAGIGLDYGALAGDLWLLQWATSRDGVQRRWGREFYSFHKQTAAEDVAKQAPEGES